MMRDSARRALSYRPPVAWRVAALVAYCIGGAGCATYQNKSALQLEAFKLGQSQQAIEYYEARQSGKDKQLSMVEAGRFKLLNGDFGGSQREFEKAIAEVFELQEGAMIRLKDVGGSVLASTLLDDTSRPYNLASFEAVFSFQQQALNWIFLGDIGSASVELRRAIWAQDLIAEKYEREIEKAKNEADDRYARGLGSLEEYYGRMGPVLGRVKSGFQNPYVWYFSGLMLEQQGDSGNAYIAYKKAWELQPDNLYLQKDMLRLAQHHNPGEWQALRGRLGVIEEPAPAMNAEVLVIYEEGLISQRHSEGLAIFVLNGFHKISFPVYHDGPYQPAKVLLKVDGKDFGSLQPLCHVQALAYHDLKEQMPGIAVRNMTRIISREIAKSASRQSDNGMVQLIGFVGAGLASLADEADTRGWYSLPMAVQMMRKGLEPGSHTVRLVGGISGKVLDIPIVLEQGELKLIWVADIGARTSIGVAPLSHNGGTPVEFSQTGTGENRPDLP